MTNLKLFVWPEFSPDYTDGLAFAIAKTEKQARKIIIEKCGWVPAYWGVVEIRKLDKPCAYLVHGGS